MTTSPASSANPELVARVAQNLATLRARIAATGRDPDTIRVVAVTKTFGVDAVRAAAANGLRDLGENYVDELETKYAQSRDLDLSWYFLGALQSNKIAPGGGLRARTLRGLAGEGVGAYRDEYTATGALRPGGLHRAPRGETAPARPRWRHWSRARAISGSTCAVS